VKVEIFLSASWAGINCWLVCLWHAVESLADSMLSLQSTQLFHQTCCNPVHDRAQQQPA
jgi:hypothetical protein